jgi:hypothetical protein
MGDSKMVQRLTKHEVVNHPTKPMKYITVRAQIVVTHVTSYDLLIKRVILYPLGITIDFSKEIAYYNLGWQIRTSGNPSLPMKLIEGQVKKSNRFTMLAIFSCLPHEFEILEGDIHDRDEPPNGELAMSQPHEMAFI